MTAGCRVRRAVPIPIGPYWWSSFSSRVISPSPAPFPCPSLRSHARRFVLMSVAPFPCPLYRSSALRSIPISLTPFPCPSPVPFRRPVAAMPYRKAALTERRPATTPGETAAGERVNMPPLLTTRNTHQGRRQSGLTTLPATRSDMVQESTNRQRYCKTILVLPHLSWLLRVIQFRPLTWQ